MSEPKSDKQLDKLPNEIMSSAQLYQVISQLGSLADKGDTESDEIQDIADTLKIFFNKKPTLKEVVTLKNQLESIIQSAPVVRLTLSDFPEPSFCSDLAGWFRSINPYCLVEILVDSSIIGGVVIRSGRRIYDYSIRSQLSHSEGALTGIIADA